jgi:hypothetical protein
LILAILFRFFGFLAPKDFYVIWLSEFGNFVITLISNLSTLTVPDDGYSTLTVPDDGYSTLTVPDDGYSTLTVPDDGYSTLTVPDDGYSRNAWCALN